MRYLLPSAVLLLIAGAAPAGAAQNQPACVAGSAIGLTLVKPEQTSPANASASERKRVYRLEALDGCALNVVGVTPTGIRSLYLENDLFVLLPGDSTEERTLYVNHALGGESVPPTFEEQVTFDQVRQSRVATLVPAKQNVNQTALGFYVSNEVLRLSQVSPPDCSETCSESPRGFYDGVTISASLDGGPYMAAAFRRDHSGSVEVSFEWIEPKT